MCLPDLKFSDQIPETQLYFYIAQTRQEARPIVLILPTS